MPQQIRKAKTRDVQQLAELAQKGYESSPVFSFVRTKSWKYPQDTVKSYRQELRVLVANPKLKFTILEVDNQPRSGSQHTILGKSVPQVTISECHLEKMPRWNSNCKGCPPPRIVGFAIWRLGSDSGEIQRSIWKKVKYVCVTLRAQLTALAWKPRDTDQTRAAKVENLCQEAQKSFGERSMELEQMVVHPDFQRQRYGTKLAEEGLSIAREEDRAVWVIATPNGEKLYETLGFIRTKEVEAVDGDARCALAVCRYVVKTGMTED